MNKLRALALLTLLFALPAAAAAQAFVKDTKSEREIKAVFDVTSTGWNTGDLSKYLYAYVPDATEMLSTGPTGGVEAIEKTMKDGFWKTGRPLQELRSRSKNAR